MLAGNQGKLTLSSANSMASPVSVLLGDACLARGEVGRVCKRNNAIAGVAFPTNKWKCFEVEIPDSVSLHRPPYGPGLEPGYLIWWNKGTADWCSACHFLGKTGLFLTTLSADIETAWLL
jgi:hypothetical protein